ncbi:hypothetical protein GBA52_025834 [Prunus armeniaca]|nr:hypothetical protein GBA52_025834 [Prunus armeniaca]
MERKVLGNLSGHFGEKPMQTKQEDGIPPLSLEEVTNPDTASRVGVNPKSPVEKENATVKDLKTEEEQSETSNSQEKTLKKPDKILPCPAVIAWIPSSVTTIITRQPTPALLQELSEILDSWWDHEECACGCRTS